MKTPRAIIFDWDGTLVDTSEASYRCYVRLFESYSMPFDRDTYARTYSPNWYHTFRCMGLAEEHWAEADSRWLSFFANEQIALIDGAGDVIAAITERGIAASIVTSGSRDRVVRELHAHGLAPHFSHCVFGSDVTNKKPHPEGLLICLERLGVHADDAMYVGDSPEDIAMAKAAGVFSIAVPGSYPNRDALLAVGADALVDSIRDLMGSAGVLARSR
ncbi:MAG TPA: HAD family hydrolase [Thermoanaerobaculia bacterium]|nr:HAD family hydrolase [Thermoanaerobaculia bacterium]